MQASSQPSSTGVPVYVMLPLDTVWLVEREGRKYSVFACTKPGQLDNHTRADAHICCAKRSWSLVLAALNTACLPVQPTWLQHELLLTQELDAIRFFDHC